MVNASRFNSNLLENLFKPESPGTVGTKIYYLAFELFTIIYTAKYAWEWGFYLQRLSDVVLPLGIANYMNVEFLFGSSLSIINAAIITLCCLLAFANTKLRWFYAVAAFLLHLQYASRFSQGEIPHSANLLGFSLLGLGIGGIFFRQKMESLYFALGFTIFFLGLGYTSAAISKLIGTGFDWPNGSHLWLWIGEKGVDVLSAYGSFSPNWIQKLALNNWYLATIMLTGSLIAEASAFLMWWKSFRPYIFVIILGLHVGIDLTMNILFLTYTIELIIIGFPWYKSINQVWSRYVGDPAGNPKIQLRSVLKLNMKMRF